MLATEHTDPSWIMVLLRGIAHAGASPHWEQLWSGGLPKGTRFDVAGVALPLAAELKRRQAANALPRDGMTALVPGCGRAYDALALAEHGFTSVVAIDVSQSACEAARAEIGASSSPTSSRVDVRCQDFFALDGNKERFDLIWDCTFLCALAPTVREQWAAQMRSLCAPDGELLTAIFPIGQREGGPPFAMSVPLVRSLLESAGFEAALIRTDLPLKEQHRRPGDHLSSVLNRGTALGTWRLLFPSAGCEALDTRGSKYSPRPAPPRVAPRAQLDTRGFLVVPAAAGQDTVDRLRVTLEAMSEEAEAGGYRIWTPADALPASCRKWAETDAAAILQQALPHDTPPVRLLGGAALWKRAGVHEATPFHQDFAYSEAREPGSTARRTTRHAAVWLALTSTGRHNGCLRFAPSLGYELQPHRTLPRTHAQSGFETHMVDTNAAESAAEDCALEAGGAVVIGDQVVHGSHACDAGVSDRLAFSPLFEVDCIGCPLPAGKASE